MSLAALPQLLVNGLFTGSLYALLALSWGLIFSTTGVFHFAHALTVVVGAYAVVLSAGAVGLPLLPAMLAAALAGGVAGLAMERVLYRPLRRRNALQLNVFLASLGALIAGEALAQLVFGPNSRPVQGFVSSSWVIGPVAISNVELLMAVGSWVVILGVLAFLRWTRYGLAIRAVEDNRSLAASFGIDAPSIFAVVFLVGSIMAGVAGGMLALRDAATPTMGVAPVLAGFVAVFMGGIGSTTGAVVGGLLLGLLQNLGGIALPGHLQGVVAFVALFVVLIWKPTGLFSSGRG